MFVTVLDAKNVFVIFVRERCDGINEDLFFFSFISFHGMEHKKGVCLFFVPVMSESSKTKKFNLVNFVLILLLCVCLNEYFFRYKL